MICPHCNNIHDEPLACPKGATIKISAQLVLEQAILISELRTRIKKLLSQHPADCVRINNESAANDLSMLMHMTWDNRVHQILLKPYGALNAVKNDNH